MAFRQDGDEVVEEAPVSVVRLWIRVTPGAARAAVGGTYPRPGGDALRVAVRERAVDGRASAAALALVADALGVPSRAVRLDVGARGREKLLSVDTGDSAALTLRIQDLMKNGYE